MLQHQFSNNEPGNYFGVFEAILICTSKDPDVHFAHFDEFLFFSVQNLQLW